MATPLSSFYSSIRLFAQQCPDATIDKYLIEAVRFFCRESWYYQATLIIDQTADQATYQIVPSTGEEVIGIDSVEQNDAVIYPLDQRMIGRNNNELTGYAFEPPNYFILSPTPTETIVDALELRLVLQPPENASTIPDSIYRNYKETIISGALAYILAMQNEAWSNPALSDTHLRLFHVGIFKAKGERFNGFRAGPMSVNPRRFLI